ncbi:unnamed protein product, partial [marine sediment metagenome]
QQQEQEQREQREQLVSNTTRATISESIKEHRKSFERNIDTNYCGGYSDCCCFLYCFCSVSDREHGIWKQLLSSILTCCCGGCRHGSSVSKNVIKLQNKIAVFQDEVGISDDEVEYLTLDYIRNKKASYRRLSSISFIQFV